ncbi:MAG: hypothetical protein JRI23_28030 [Deltaproteobacteria bacterium]|jgi:hypothetical protein|nr:hypothetical protein [Deltaproteobacteria bacterium]MBW2535941.1 hypothetical protein [Deltaproteobacteria bacterium]
MTTRIRRMARRLLPLSATFALLGACSMDADDNDLANPLPGTDGAGAAGAADGFDGSGSADGSGGAGSETETSCGATGFSVEVRQPNVLVLFDRSCSMRRRLDTSEIRFGTGPDDPRTRWFAAREAVRTITQAYEAQIRFGLMAFPEPYEGCDELPIVDVMPDLLASNAVMTALHQSPVQPFSVCVGDPAPQPFVTPTSEALEAIISSGVLDDPTRDNLVLLLTDGGATCGPTHDAITAELGSLTGQLLQSGVKTAAIGFGDQFVGSEAVAKLEAIAEAGGLPRPGGPPSFWPATDANQLQSALDDIIADAVSCTFALQGTPPDDDKLYAFLDGQEVLRDDPDGFSYDSADNAVTFHGAACDDIQDGSVQSINVVYGCPEDLCTPSEEVCDGIDNDCDDQVDEGVCAN